METSWCHFFSMHLFVLFSLHCFSFLQATLHETSTLCHADERSALLQFKQSFTINNSSSGEPSAYPKVASWSTQEGDHERSNCCSWDGVECDEDSGHVIGLDLSSSCLLGSVNSSSTLFQLAHLQRLDLSDNNFTYSEIPSRLGHDLTSLRYLNLSNSSFSGQIPSQISELSKLSTLDLSFNFDVNLTEANLRSIVQNMTNIKQLHLSRVHIPSTVPDIIVNASSLTSLRLERCWLQGEFPVGIFHLPNLEVLHLKYNRHLNGYFPDDLNMSSPLKELNVRLTNFSGHLPASIGNLNSLNLLDVSGTEFSGHLPASIGNLRSLNLLDVSLTKFSGHLPASIGNLRSLNLLDVSSTKFSGHLPASIGNLRSLNLLDIRGCYFYPHLPSSLGNLTHLSYLELYHFYDPTFDSWRNIHNLSGQVIDSWSWVGKLTKLRHLGLGYTNLRGEFPCFVANLTQLVELDLSHNQISGEIPSWLMNLTQLTVLNLKNNNLQGPIPRSLFNLQNLEHLQLSSNNLSGVVEFDEFSKLKRLKELRLSSNKLSLQITTSFNATAPQFEVLDLGSCNLTEFPQFIDNQYKLQKLNLSDNQIHGQIPKWMWTATRDTLRYLNLAHNFLSGFEQNPGTLPWPSLSSLYLGFNRLQGSLPIPRPSIEVYSVPNNDYTGEISPSFCNLSSLYLFDLSNNNMSGMLPRCIGNSSALGVLDLQNNSFGGDIPQMCSSGNSELAMIDLSSNQFQGKIPRSFANCTQLESLDVGNNQMSDIFPSWLGALPALRVLILRSNRFHGIIGKPATDQEFSELCMIDLSNNGFSSMFPLKYYFDNWNCMKSVDQAEKPYYQLSMTIVAKGIELKYVKIPDHLKLIDISSNKLEGEIPGIIGNLKGLRFLNLSNNIFTGPIPSSVGNLTYLESFDLSRNKLSGKIPSTLVQLNFLEYFNVSDNQLWGEIPHGQQFNTFENKSYQGNSGLCGLPLSKRCEDYESSTPPPPSTFEANGFQIELDWYVVLPGAVSGLVVGVISGNIFTNRKHDWFVKTFGRRRRQKL